MKTRGEVVFGKTYKLKPPEGSALYLTINDIDGAPIEVFINSKDVSHYQWVSALTRTASAALRAGVPASLLAEEWVATHNPAGGYFVSGEGYVPGLVSHMGLIFQRHIAALTENRNEDK